MTGGPILPPAMLGLLGGGQLGRMFTVAARTMGYRVTVLDPDPEPIAAELADVHLRASFSDREALAELARTCAAVTTEFENVNADSMRWLAERIPVSPSGDCVAIAQDRIREKRRFREAGLPTGPYLALERLEDLNRDLEPFLPGILKTTRLGYDGKGQVGVATPTEARAAYADLGCQPCVLERRLPLAREISVILARSAAGEVAVFPVPENRHARGILDLSIVPAGVGPAVADRAQEMAVRLAESLDYVGVLAVEFFLLEDGQLVLNEMAPRPHNSGHFTLDACATSQFQQQVRMMCGLPPGSPRLLSPAVMANLLGDAWRGTEPPRWEAVLREPAAHLHLYGKREAPPGRKMGHVTVLADAPEAALARMSALRKGL